MRAALPSLWCSNTLRLFDEHRLAVCTSLCRLNTLRLFHGHRLRAVGP
jgi:hypothetical protein